MFDRRFGRQKIILSRNGEHYVADYRPSILLDGDDIFEEGGQSVSETLRKSIDTLHLASLKSLVVEVSEKFLGNSDVRKGNLDAVREAFYRAAAEQGINYLKFKLTR